MTIDEMRNVVEQAVMRLPVRRLPAAQCLRGTLAAPLIAAADMPGVDISAMDGFAFRGPAPWRLRRSALTAGAAPGPPLNLDEAVRIATGAATPVGTTAVLRAEHSQVSGRTVFATVTAPTPGSDMRLRGENWAKQTMLASAGNPLSANVVSGRPQCRSAVSRSSHSPSRAHRHHR